MYSLSAFIPVALVPSAGPQPVIVVSSLNKLSSILDMEASVHATLVLEDVSKSVMIRVKGDFE